MKEEGRKYRRVWIRGHYWKTKFKGSNGKPIFKWVNGYWRKIKIK